MSFFFLDTFLGGHFLFFFIFCSSSFFVLLHFLFFFIFCLACGGLPRRVRVRVRVNAVGP